MKVDPSAPGEVDKSILVAAKPHRKQARGWTTELRFIADFTWVIWFMYLAPMLMDDWGFAAFSRE